MWTTLLTVTGGASLGVAMIFSQPEVKEKPVKKEVIPYTASAKEFPVQKIDKPVIAETPELEVPVNESNPETPGLPEDLGTLPLKNPKLTTENVIPVYRKPQTTESFTKVHVAGALRVELSQRQACSILIEPESAKDLVQVEVQNGTLYLKNAPNRKNRTEKVVVKVTVKDLTELFTSGATNLVGMNEFELSTLKLEADGASDVNLNLKVTKLTGNFSGASDVDISGVCDMLKLDVSGASQAKLTALSVKKAIVDNSGAGQVDLSVSEEIKIDGSGASETTYKIHGDSKSVSESVSTSGAATAKKK